MKVKKINLQIILFVFFVIFPTWRCAKRIRSKRMKCDRAQSKHQWKHIEMYLFISLEALKTILELKPHSFDDHNCNQYIHVLV